MVAPDNERVKDPCEEMARLANTFLPLKKWGYKESYRSNTSGDLIYDSAWCRINLVWGEWEMYAGNTMSIYYGRLHASNNQQTLIWQGENCHCWHREILPLHFLDGHTPEFGAKNIYSHGFLEQFYESEFRKNFRRRQPEWLLHIHAMIWENYAPRLFEVFDLRHPDSWEQYRQFVKQVYEIKGHNPDINPPLDNIC